MRLSVTRLSATGAARRAGAGDPPPPLSAPVNTAAPSIAGSPVVYQTLTASDGAWTGFPVPSFAYQWRRNGVDISGATAQAYAVQEADHTATLTVSVTGTNTEGSASAVSDGVVIAAAAPVNAVAPVASGSTGLGDVLSTTNGTWTGFPAPAFAYQWTRNGVDIGSATSSSYTIAVSDSGASIACRVTATNAGGSLAQTSNSITAQTFTAPVIAGAPTISGTAEVGQVLTASPSGATGNPAPARTWQWLRDGASISGATGSTYTLVSADGGTDISVRQTETNALGFDAEVSAAVEVAAGVPTWNIADLFLAGQDGYAYLPSTIGTLYQDTAGTTPVAANGDVIAFVDDQSPNNNNATQATGTDTPTYDAATLGAGSMYFNGSKDLDLAALDIANGAGVVHIIAVVDPDTTSGEFAVSHVSTAVAGTPRLTLTRYNGNYRFYSRLTDAASAGLTLGGAKAGKVLIHAMWSGESGYQRISYDGVSSAATAVSKGTLPATNSAAVNVGSRGGGIKFQGHIGDAILIRGDLSDADATALYADLAARYGLTVATPQIFRPAEAPRGAWTWFNDERVIELASDTYAVGALTGNGDVVASQNAGSSWSTAMVYPGFERDDHDNPALIRRANDGRILAFYSKHNHPNLFVSVSTNPNDASSFGTPTDIDPQLGHSNNSYANIFQLPSGRFYLFWRATNAVTSNWAWHYSYTDDPNGTTGWSTGVQISGSDRPYHKFRQDGNKIHAIVNDGHPNIYGANKVYHFYLQDTAGTITFHESDGTDITALLPFSGAELTEVYGAADGRSWVADLQVDGDGNPVATYTVYPGATNLLAPDIRAYQARWSGTAWAYEEVCTMGATIYDTSVSTAEPFYNGGICGLPGNPDVVFVGRQVDGAGAIDTAAGVHQIFRYEKSGGTWAGTQLTSGTEKCFRPFVPQGSLAHLFYCRGRYTTYTNFDARITKVTL